MRNTTLTALALLVLALPVCALEWTGECVSVSDGDTITVMYGELPVRIRLYGIDAPELKQAHGKKARDLLVYLAEGQKLTLRKMDIDKYHRAVCRAWVGDLEISREMIAQGAAWVYPFFCREPECDQWRELEAQARTGRRGLWSRANPVPPWEYGKRKK